MVEHKLELFHTAQNWKTRKLPCLFEQKIAASTRGVL